MTVSPRSVTRFALLTFGLLLLRIGAAAQGNAGPITLPVGDFVAVGIQTTQVQPVASGWLTRLPAHVTVPDAQQRFVVSPLGGVVTGVLVGIGETVKEGEPLAQLTSPELLVLQREQAQAGAERERAQQTLKRDERLFAEGLIPATRLEASRSADRQASALLGEKRSLLGLVGARPGRAGELVLVSPMAGVVLSKTVRAGERVEPATTLFRIARLEPLDLEIELPVGAAAQIEAGRAVRVPGAGATGSVVAVGRAVSDAQTLTVRARLTSGLAALNPGQHVEAEIETRDNSGGPALWSVPGQALVRLGKAGAEPSVFTRRGDAYQAIPVTPIGDSGSDIVVRGDLRVGDQVVTKGASQLKAAAAGIGKGE